MILWIPDYTHPSMNTALRMHWHWRQKEQKLWDGLIFAATRGQGLHPRRPFSRAMVEITYWFRDQRKRDLDNYAPKYILDALRHERVIEDDDVTSVDVSWKLRHDPDRCGTEIVITPMEEER